MKVNKITKRRSSKRTNTKTKRRHSKRTSTKTKRRQSTSKQRRIHKISKKRKTHRGGMETPEMETPGGVTNVFTAGQNMAAQCEGKQEYDCRGANGCYWGGYLIHPVIPGGVIHAGVNIHTPVHGCKSGKKINQPFADNLNGTGNASAEQSGDYIRYVNDNPRMFSMFSTPAHRIYDWERLYNNSDKYYIKGPSRNVKYH